MFRASPAILGCRHQRRPAEIRPEEPPQSAPADRPRPRRVHGVHAPARHLRLPQPHQDEEEAEPGAVPGSWVGSIVEEHLQRGQVVVRRGMEQEAAFSLFI